MNNALPTSDPLSFARTKTKSSRLPGMYFIWLGLTIFAFSGVRNVLFYWGIPLSLRLISQFSGIIGGMCMVWGMRRYTSSMHVIPLVRPNHRLMIIIWQVLLVGLAIAGIVIGNPLSVIGKEFIILWLFGEFWMVGADDHFWVAIEKPLTITFYLAAILIFFYYTTPAIKTGILGSEQVSVGDFDRRYISTIGFGLRPLLGSGLFLFVWGIVRPRHDIWRNLQIGAIFVGFIITVILFKFRAAAFTYIFTGLVVLIIQPFLEGRKRPGAMAFLAAAAIVFVFILIQTKTLDGFLDRASVVSQQEGVFESRLNELSAYIDDMGWAIFVGRGLGGSYDASSAIKREAATTWSTIHFGILVFTLKGGIAMVGIFLSFLGAGFKLRPKFWYKNRMNLTATLLFPALLLEWFFNPFSLTTDAVFTYLPTMIILARFGRRTKIDVPYYKLSKVPPPPSLKIPESIE